MLSDSTLKILLGFIPIACRKKYKICNYSYTKTTTKHSEYLVGKNVPSLVSISGPERVPPREEPSYAAVDFGQKESSFEFKF